jgi:hypothetical protein
LVQRVSYLLPQLSRESSQLPLGHSAKSQA